MVHGYGCMLAEFSCYIEVRAEYPKGGLALKQVVVASSSGVQVGNTAFSLF